MRPLHALIPGLALLALACGPDRPDSAASRGQAVVHAAVAANLRPAFEELVAAFAARHAGAAVQPTYTASGVAYQQILAGAPFDLFVSADSALPAALDSAGRAEPGTRRVYATGALALWTSARVPASVDGVRALGGGAVRRVAVANPETAPYGRAAIQALERAGVLRAVQPKLVYGQDAAQAAQIALAGADAALLPLSLARTPPLAAAGRVRALDDTLYAPIAQALVVVKGRASADVLAFVEFLGSDEGRAILLRHGYQ